MLSDSWAGRNPARVVVPIEEEGCIKYMRQLAKESPVCDAKTVEVCGTWSGRGFELTATNDFTAIPGILGDCHKGVRHISDESCFRIQWKIPQTAACLSRKCSRRGRLLAVTRTTPPYALGGVLSDLKSAGLTRLDFTHICKLNLQIKYCYVYSIFKYVIFKLIPAAPLQAFHEATSAHAVSSYCLDLCPSVSHCFSFLLYPYPPSPSRSSPYTFSLGSSNSKFAVLYQSNSSTVYVRSTSNFAVRFALLLAPIVPATIGLHSR
jgi:hypothetical protein